MKILFTAISAVPAYPDIEVEKGLGTSEIAIQKITKLWAAQGHDVTVLMPTETGYDYIHQGVHVIPPGYSLEEEYDLHVAYRNPFIFPVRARKRVFYSMDDISTPAVKGLLEANWKEFDRIHVLSEYHREQFVWVGVDPHRIQITPPGIDDHYLPVKRKSGRTGVAVYTSAPYKGLPMLASMWPQIHQTTGLRLRVFGDMRLHGSSTKYFDFLYAELKRMPGVELFEPLPQPELFAMLSLSDLMLAPSTYPETYGNAMAEAIACGVPVVTNDLGAMRTTVGNSGVIISEKPQEATFRASYINAVKQALDTLDNLREHAQNSRITTWAHTAEKLL